MRILNSFVSSFETVRIFPACCCDPPRDDEQPRARRDVQPEPVGDGLPRQPGADQGVDPRGQGGGLHVPHGARARDHGLRLRGLVPRARHVRARVGEPPRAARRRPDRRDPVRRRHARAAPQRRVQLPRRVPRPQDRRPPPEGLPRERRQLPRDALLHAVVRRPEPPGARAARGVPAAAEPPSPHRRDDRADRRLRRRGARHRAQLRDVRGALHAQGAARRPLARRRRAHRERKRLAPPGPLRRASAREPLLLLLLLLSRL